MCLPTVLLATVLHVAALNLTPLCQRRADGWCNAGSCPGVVKKHHEILPLYARLDRSAASNVTEWRCYSPSSLTTDLARYSNGTAYCTQKPSFAQEIKSCETPGPHSVDVNATRVFTEDETAECTLIRTPELIQTPSAVVLFAQCRNASDHGSVADLTEGFKDDFRRTRMVMKRSIDGGKSWGPMAFLTPQDTGVGVAIYDEYAKTVVFQYQRMPNRNPYQNNTLYQLISADDGLSWSSPRDITHMLRSCYPPGKDPAPNLVCGAAGAV
jgi:hypothetical protein